MKFAYICGFAWEPKGTVRARAHPLAVELVRMGHEVTIYVTPYDNPAYSGLEMLQDGVRIVNLEVSSSRLLWAGLPFALMRKVLDFCPDVVHVFKPKGFAGAAAMLLLNRKFRSMVLDCDDWEGWGGWNEVKDYPWILKQAIDFQEQWLIRSVPVLTVASRVLLARAVQMGRRREDIFYAPNGISGGALAILEEHASRDAQAQKLALGLPMSPAIFYAGHFDPADDVMFFCNTVAPVAARHGATVVVVGEGPELPQAKQFFAAHDQPKAVFFEQLPYERYAQVLAACDVAVFPYPDNPVYRAKCSARIIDYMACSKPVLTTAVGQNAEYIVHGENGLLTPPGDARAYAAALESLLSDTELRRKLGSNAHRHVREKFHWAEVALPSCCRAYQRIAALTCYPTATIV